MNLVFTFSFKNFSEQKKKKFSKKKIACWPFFIVSILN